MIIIIIKIFVKRHIGKAMAVSVSVNEIFSVKEWCDLENRVNSLYTMNSGEMIEYCHNFWYEKDRVV